MPYTSGKDKSAARYTYTMPCMSHQMKGETVSTMVSNSIGIDCLSACRPKAVLIYFFARTGAVGKITQKSYRPRLFGVRVLLLRTCQNTLVKGQTK